MLQRACFLPLMLLAISPTLAAESHTLHSFDRIQLSDQFHCEGATFADVNRDGAMDIVAGPYWYAGPKFLERTEIYTPTIFDVRNFSDNFFAFPYDLNDDGWVDILVVGFPGKEAYWYQNPKNRSGHWTRCLIHKEVDNESPHFTDLTGDGRPELVFHTGGRFGYMEIPSDPTGEWDFHPISDDRGITRFTHGLGIGDLNGDGRKDIIEKTGWWEQPETKPNSLWKHHAFEFAQEGGAQMYVYDVDGDGDNDVITSKHAHGFGLAWFENLDPGNGSSFREHTIMGERPDENDYGISFAKLHALELVDMDGDGLLDIVTGRRPSAPSSDNAISPQPAVLYWFKTAREGKRVRFVPYRIDINSGVGTQLVAGDANGDQFPDLVVANKRGTFVFLNHAEMVDQATWQQAQPKRINAAEGN